MTEKTRKLDFYAWHAFDYAADTSHLAREADYAYRRIIDEIFRTAQDSCRIKDDDEYLCAVARATPTEWPAIRRALIDGAKPLLKKRGSWISQPRLTEEIRRAQEKSGIARRAVDERERKRRSSNDDRTIIVRSSTETKTKNKKEKKQGVANATPTETMAIRTALREAGIGVSKAAERLIDRWSVVPGSARVVELLAANLDRVQAARSPLSYLGVIVKRNDSEVAPTHRDTRGLTQAEWDNLYAGADPPRPYGMTTEDYEALRRRTYPEQSEDEKRRTA